MCFDPEYIKTLSRVQPEPDGCKRLRQRNINRDRKKEADEIAKLERESDIRFGLATD